MPIESGRESLYTDIATIVEMLRFYFSIVYLRDDQNEKIKIFIGNYSGNKMSPERGRYIIRFSKLAEVGITDANWFEFADGSQNPVCYVAG